jgi:PAS domain S-box-containing protein
MLLASLVQLYNTREKNWLIYGDISMKNEPDIVKQLREEEQLGTLHNKTRNTSYDYEYDRRSYMDPSLRNQADREADARENMIHVSIDYERRLLEAEEKYEKIFRLCPEAIVIIDRNGVIIDINERTYDWLGFRPDEVIGNTILELPFLSVDEKIKAKKKFLERISGKDISPYELVFISKNEEQKIGLVRGVAIKDECRNNIESLLMISDVTDQRKANNILHRTIEQLKELEFIVNHSGAVAFLWRAAEGWPVEFVSENIIQFGYFKEELLAGKITYTSLIHEEDRERINAEVERYCSQGVKEFSQEYRILTKIGEERWVEDRTWIRRDSSGTITHFQGIILDITERKHAETELKKAHEQLTELNRKLEQKIKQRTVSLIKQQHTTTKQKNKTG